MEEDNWRPRIVAVENVLQSWKARTLSYQGRALVVNALALSRIWYMASIFGVPAWVVWELNILVFGFFWKGNLELVARRVVVQASCFGGFSVVSVQLCPRCAGECSGARSFQPPQFSFVVLGLLLVYFGDA